MQILHGPKALSGAAPGQRGLDPPDRVEAGADARERGAEDRIHLIAGLVQDPLGPGHSEAASDAGPLELAGGHAGARLAYAQA